MKQGILSSVIAGALLMSAQVNAADYVIDTQGAHASVQFSVSHLGYSFVVGRFNDFAGDFSFDSSDIGASKVNVTINTASIDSNHAERDKHLRSSDFLNVAKFPKATFTSTSVEPQGDGEFVLKGQLSLNGVTKEVTIDAHLVGEGKDPWGGYRVGFVGQAELALKDYNIKMDLGPASSHVNLDLVVEGIRQ